MNHFFALPLPPAIREELAKLAEQWRRLPVERASWFGTNDFHIALKFLGDIDAARQPELIEAALPITERTAQFTVDLNSPAGAFPNLKQPRVLWAGVQNNQPMADLAGALDKATAAIGFAGERRPFKPHITLARCRPERGNHRSPSVVRRVGGDGHPDRAWRTPPEQVFPLFIADQFVLMHTLSPQKDGQKEKNADRARYNIVRTFPLGVTGNDEQMIW